ncbi:MAG: hypothetical protein IJ733_03090 [Lachnospiraceae bacterium]|nr:hypothetical protein [Lachnospiraceae bacterium]
MRKQTVKRALAMSLALVTVVGGVQYPANAEETTNAVKYVTMNVPYTAFYEAYKPTDSAVWNVNAGKAGAEELDAVTTATTSKFLGTDGLAKGTYNDGTNILGVTLPVAVSAEDYANLKTDLKETENYYFSDLKETPKAYSTLSVADGKYSFSKLQDSAVDVSNLSVTDYDITSQYGDYLIALNGVGTDGKLVTGEEYTIYGAILTIDDKTYGMTALENLWWGNKVTNAEIAWSIKQGGQKKNHGGATFYQFDFNGGTLSNVSLLTNLGVINITANTELDKYYPGDTSGLNFALPNDSDTLTISGIPADLTNPKVSVSYTVNRQTTTVADKLEVKDGKITLSEKAKPEITYTVTISSDNFADINKTIATPITEDEKTELLGLMDKAKKTVDYDTNTDLEAHVDEADTLIKNEKATSVEARALASELLEKIKKTYPALTIESLTLQDSVLTIGLKEELSTLGTATYTLTSGEGKSVKTLASGEITELTITLKDVPEAGTEYTLKIVSENYQDTTKKVTAEAAAAPTAEPSSDPSAEPTVAPSEAPAAAKKAAVIKVKTASKTYKAALLKKKAQSFSIGASVNSGGKLTYSKVSGNAKLTIKNGKITVKKNTAKGTYKIKVKIKAAAKGDYKAAAVTKTIKVTVK